MTSTKLENDPPRFVRLTSDEYHADPCVMPSLSASIACKLVEDCPAIAYAAHPRLGGSRAGKPTKATDAGSVQHALLLNGGKGIAECHYENFKTKAAQDDRDAVIADGRVPILTKELESAKRVAEILKSRLAAQGMVFSGETEIVALWTETADDGTVVPCRAMIDHVLITPSRAQIDDLKTGRTANPEKLGRHMCDFGYDIQAAAYTSAVTKIHPELVGRVSFADGFCELEDPWPVTVVEHGGSMLELGNMRWRRAINLWAWCTNNNKWPAYATRRIRIDAPQFRLQRELDAQAIDNPWNNDGPPVGPSPEALARSERQAADREDEQYSDESLF